MTEGLSRRKLRKRTEGGSLGEGPSVRKPVLRTVQLAQRKRTSRKKRLEDSHGSTSWAAFPGTVNEKPTGSKRGLGKKWAKSPLTDRPHETKKADRAEHAGPPSMAAPGKGKPTL